MANKIQFVVVGDTGDTGVFLTKCHWGDYDFFSAEHYDTHKTYKKDAVFIINEFALHGANKEIIEFLLKDGHKVVVDAVWESLCNNGYALWEKYRDNILLMFSGARNIYEPCDASCVVPNYFWIKEYFFNTSRGLNMYVPNPTHNKLFFMPIKTRKPARDLLYDALSKYSDNAVISYFDRGIMLPMDITDTNLVSDDRHSFDRNFNSDWYDETYFSVVSETLVTSSKKEYKNVGQVSSYTNAKSIFITEKTFKPIAFEHPFIILGQCGTAQRLQELGFDTYGHLFMNLYDSTENLYARIDRIVDCVEDFDLDKFNDPRTKEIAMHNRAHFYNKALVHKMLEEEIINPLMEFVNG